MEHEKKHEGHRGKGMKSGHGKHGGGMTKKEHGFSAKVGHGKDGKGSKLEGPHDEGMHHK